MQSVLFFCIGSFGIFDMLSSVKYLASFFTCSVQLSLYIFKLKKLIPGDCIV